MELNHYQKYGKKWYEKNREKELERASEYYKDNLDKAKSKYSRRRNTILLERYNITESQYENLLSSQDGKCAICKGQSKKRLDVDHCHETGIVRGLLCNNCNRALGHFKDSIQNLEVAISYLRYSKTKR